MNNSAAAAKLRAVTNAPAELFEVIGWVRSTDRMPDANRLVLGCYGAGMVYIMVWTGESWWNAEGDKFTPQSRRVRYWTYMPHGPIDTVAGD